MKSIANQYRDLKEGRMSQANFMRNLRMTMPHYVTNTTSYNDAVKILRNKGILTENIVKQLEKGIEVEKEHTKDEVKAAQIAIDHLKEDPKYYTKLTKAGLEEEMDDDDAETLAMIDKIEKEKEGEEAVMAQYDENLNEAKSWTNTDGKEMYAQFKEIDNLNSQEVLIGIDFEMEENHELSKEEAAKIVVRKLKQNPNYYTSHALAGREMKEIPTIGKLIPGSDQMKSLKNEADLIDKDNGMKPVKGVEKIKASANKATKETNKPEGTISLMSLVAKTSKGVTKMVATGEKMKVVKEGYEDFLAQKKSEETAAETHNGFKRGDKVMIDPDAAKATGLKAGKVYTITNFRIYKKGSILQNVDALLDNGEEINVDYIFKAPKVFTSPTNLGKYDLGKLKEIVREVLAEMESDDEVNTDVMLGLGETFDGRDNLTDTAGHQNEGMVSGALAKVKDKIVNSSLFKKLIDTIVSKMSDKDIAAFKAKFNISEAEGGPSLEDIMSKVNAINPDKTAKTPEDLKEALDEDTLEGKIASLVRSVAGINLLLLGGAPLGVFINSLLGISTWGFGAFIGPVISLVASLIIHGISSRLLGKTDDDSVV